MVARGINLNQLINYLTLQSPLTISAIAKVPLRLAVVATQSAGKSTLINALMGTSLLATKNQACTLKCLRIANRQIDSWQLSVTDEQGVVQSMLATPELLIELNHRADSTDAHLQGRFAGLADCIDLLEIIDTPGPNSANDALRSQVALAFSQVLANAQVLYVLNATQLGVNDDAALLGVLKTQGVNPVFVLNQVDCLDDERDSLHDVMSNAVSYLTELGFNDPLIVPLSARAAQLARKASHELTRYERNALKSFTDAFAHRPGYLVEHARVPKLVYDSLCREIQQLEHLQPLPMNETSKSDAAALCLASGVRTLETLILHMTQALNGLSLGCADDSCAVPASPQSQSHLLMKIALSHNPFVNHTQLSIDGSAVDSQSCLGERLTAPMRRWVGDFFSLLAAYLNGPEAIEVIFCGLASDAAELELAAEAMRAKGMRIRLKCSAIAEADERLAGLQHIYEEAKAGPIAAFLGDGFAERFQIEMNPNCEINVIATMSSGKSTFINSLLGQDLLPSKNLACTATLTRIMQQPGLEEVQGIRITNAEIEAKSEGERCPVDLNTLRQWNADDTTVQMNLFAALPYIESSDHSRLVIIDTPGTNNSRDQRHEMVTRRAISDKTMPLVLYLLNARQLEINDDQHLLRMVRDAMSSNGRQGRDRFVFLLNQVDAVDVEKEPVTELLATAKQYLARNDIHDALLLPISAELARLLRQQQAGLPLTRSEMSKLASMQDCFLAMPQFQLLQYMNVSPSVRLTAERTIAQAMAAHDESTLAMWYSGVPIVELVISEYIRKYALPDRVFRTQALFGTFLDQATNEAQMIQELRDRSQTELNKLQIGLQKIQADITTGERNLELKEELRVRSFKMPKKAQDALADAEIKFQCAMTKFRNSLNQDKVEPSLAKRLLDETKLESAELRKDAISRLEQAMQLAQKEEAIRLRDAYTRYVGDLFGGDGSHIRMPVMGKMQAAVLGFADTAILVEMHTIKIETGRRRVSTSTWYIPWTWGDEHVIVDYSTTTNLEAASRPMLAKLRSDFESLLKSAESSIRDQSKFACERFIEEMDTSLKVAIDELLVNAKEAMSDSAARQFSIREADEKLQWINGFRKKLDALLSGQATELQS